MISFSFANQHPARRPRAQHLLDRRAGERARVRPRPRVPVHRRQSALQRSDDLPDRLRRREVLPQQARAVRRVEGRATCKCSSTQNSHTMLLERLRSRHADDAGAARHDDASRRPARRRSPNGIASSRERVRRSAASRRSSSTSTAAGGRDDPGVPFGPNGQPIRRTTRSRCRRTLPDGIIDIVVKAYDDLGIVDRDATPITVTKGAPCTDASTAACRIRCATPAAALWPAPTGDARRRRAATTSSARAGSARAPASGKQCSQTVQHRRADELPDRASTASATTQSRHLLAADRGRLLQRRAAAPGAARGPTLGAAALVARSADAAPQALIRCAPCVRLLVCLALLTATRRARRHDRDRRRSPS